jgi:hypothetical protein
MYVYVYKITGVYYEYYQLTNWDAPPSKALCGFRS